MDAEDSRHWVRKVKRIKKRVKLQRMKDSIKTTRRAGLKVECFLIIGFPDESLVEILQTYRFILQLAWLGVEDIGYSGYRPVPGSEISDDLHASGALTYDDGVYLSLMKSTSIFGCVSWNPRFSDRQLGLLRAAGLAIFYSAAFILRPWRLARLVRNVIARRQTTKLDRVFIQLFDRPPDATASLRSEIDPVTTSVMATDVPPPRRVGAWFGWAPRLPARSPAR